MKLQALTEQDWDLLGLGLRDLAEAREEVGILTEILRLVGTLTKIRECQRRPLSLQVKLDGDAALVDLLLKQRERYLISLALLGLLRRHATWHRRQINTLCHRLGMEGDVMLRWAEESLRREIDFSDQIDECAGTLAAQS